MRGLGFALTITSHHDIILLIKTKLIPGVNTAIATAHNNTLFNTFKLISGEKVSRRIT